MSKSLSVFAAGATVLVLGGAYWLADSMVEKVGKADQTVTFVAGTEPAIEEKVETAAAKPETAMATVQTAAAEMAKPVAAEGSAASLEGAGGDADYADEGFMPAGKLNVGRAALPEEIAAWNIDVAPYDKGLPPGQGSVADGEEIFAEKCAMCHGDFGEGVDRWPVLAGGQGTLASDNPVKTIGSYWPYFSTVWDYVHRAMPFGNAQSLTNDEVYAIAAYLLYVNDLVGEDFVLNQDNFASIKLPNENGFYMDDRDKTEYPLFRREPCMSNCKGEVKIVMRARVVDVTPEDAVARKRAEEAAKKAAMKAKSGAGEATPAAATPAPAEESKAAPAAESKPTETASAAADPALIKKGEKVFKKCKSCHAVGPGAKNKVGPELNGLIGRPVGSVEGFRYSKAFKELHDAGKVWDEAFFAEFIKNPKGTVKGTKMSFRGLKKDSDIEALIAYLKQF